MNCNHAKGLHSGQRHKFLGRPDPRNKDRHRCGAKLHGQLAWCRRWPVKGKKRCRLHGGLSTGAKTPEGKARALAALSEGRRRWIAQMKAEGKKFPWGRKAGYSWTTPAMRMRQMQALQDSAESAALPRRPTRSELRTMPFEELRRAALQALEGLRVPFRRAPQ
jgi:hypothetical protein